MSSGHTPGFAAMKNPEILSFGKQLPENVNVISLLESGEWVTQVSFGGSYRISGLVVQGMYENGTLSLGVNNRQINAVYRYTEAGEEPINRFSGALTQNADIGLYICPHKPGRVLLHHNYLHKTLPVTGNAEVVNNCIEITFAGFCEHTEINCADKTILNQTEMNEQYKAVLDPVNALSTLLKLERIGSRTLSVTDIRTGMPVYIPRER